MAEPKNLSWITNYIWGIADDVLRDLYKRGEYRDIILPATVLRRFDAVLEGSKQSVLEMKASLDAKGIVEQDLALRQAAGQAFYNTSKFTMRELKSRANRQQLKADFEAYLDGFSPNVQDIIDNFDFRHEVPKLSKADALGTLIEKLTSPEIDLSPNGIDNHGMGSIFEELVRKFNEENPEWVENMPAYYIGQSVKTPQERFADHKRGYKSSIWVEKYGVGVEPLMCELGLTRKEAEAREKVKPDEERAKGIGIWWN